MLSLALSLPLFLSLSISPSHFILLSAGPSTCSGTRVSLLAVSFQTFRCESSSPWRFSLSPSLSFSTCVFVCTPVCVNIVLSFLCFCGCSCFHVLPSVVERMSCDSGRNYMVIPDVAHRSSGSIFFTCFTVYM